MPNPGQELSSIDFESMLGGPLVAVINAQAQAAMSTVNFIKEVGFKKLAGEQDPENAETADPIYVKFKYPKEISAYQPAVAAVAAVAEVTDAAGNVTTPAVAAVDAADAVPAVYETQILEVPILTAIKNVDEKSKVDFDRCIGCGNCVAICPEDAIQLKMKEKREVPVETMDDLYEKMNEKLQKKYN